MDTRHKIQSWEEGKAALTNHTVVWGYFDPMLAAHAIRIEELAGEGRPIAVVIDSPPDAILPARSRAELAAGLAAVDRVLLPPEGAVVEFAEGIVVFREQGSDLQRLSALIRHVHERQNA